MITEREINECTLSPTKKDFYQIWNELLDTASALSSRWDPTSTNESDPGIVLLKVLTAVADKLNYEIDLNTLEGFMPSCAQEESMRKLTEMLGYNMRYYESATTDVKISYNTSKAEIPAGERIIIDRFTNIKDSEDSINYVTLNERSISRDQTSVVVPCIEGELVVCETDDNNVISINLLDSNHRYYLPETQIAENGIFVSNIDDSHESEEWTKVDNLNTIVAGKKVFKFGFDSKKMLPYIQFPDDISYLIEDGLRIKYIRTSGAYGNIAANVLSKMEKPVSWSFYENNSSGNSSADWLNEENYRISNSSGTGNGRNLESIDDAYESYKKTIGTFDTLVTCRDYINYIYRLTSDGTTPLVSNINVTDINSDINRAYTLCSFDKFGISYKNKSRKKDNNQDKISSFDLVLYPFKTIFGLNTKPEYKKSFTYDDINVPEIKTSLEEIKTISHNICLPENDELVAIKNYLRLRAKITAIRKLNAVEQKDVLATVNKKLYESFNMHKVDFGEEIPYDSILECIENADSRIKSVSLDEPELHTVYLTKNGDEIEAPNTQNQDGTDEKIIRAKNIHNKLVLNNVLAGKISLFNYDEDFVPNFKELAYPNWNEGVTTKHYEGIYPTEGLEIASLSPRFEINAGATNVKLNDNEVVQFRLQNMKTEVTYPAYVNYFIQLNDNKGGKPAIGATMIKLSEFLDTELEKEDGTKTTYWEEAANNSSLNGNIKQEKFATPDELSTALAKYKKLFVKEGDKYVIVDEPVKNVDYYYLVVTSDNSSLDVSRWNAWIKQQDANYSENNVKAKLKGLYELLKRDRSRNVGYLVDSDHNVYREYTTTKSTTGSTFDIWYVQDTYERTVIPGTGTSGHTMNGLGQDGEYYGIRANEEYELDSGEYLLINYTNSETVDEEEKKTKINKFYGPGTIIRPNFEMIDSIQYRTLHSYSKKDGFDFVGISELVPSNVPAGMFTLGTDEQIEIRNFVKVDLDEQSTNIYWTRNDEDTFTNHDSGKITFEFDEDFVEDPDGQYNEKQGKNGYYSSYTLKEGEYFYYTTKDKIDLAYYGNGTKITRKAKTPEIYKYKSDLEISSDEISSYGLAASIPWRAYNFSDDSNAQRSLSLIEFRYVNLTKDDTLETFKTIDPTTKEQSNQPLTNDWKKVSDVHYKASGGSETLDRINFKTHNVCWEARTKLELCVGPNAIQTLHNTTNSKDYIMINFRHTNGTDQSSVEPIKLENHLNNNVSIKTSDLIIYSTAHDYDATKKKFDESGQLTENIADLKIKVFKETDVKDEIKNTSMNIGNYGNGKFTKYSFKKKDGATGDVNAFSLNVNVPSQRFGLLMIYYIKSSSSTTADVAYIKSTDINLKIFNYYVGGNESWWAGQKEGDRYILREGLNIVKIDSASGSLEFWKNNNNEGVLIFGNLDLVNSSEVLNPKLKYFAVTENTSAKQALSDIRSLDTQNEFYYNNIIANDTALDLNEDEDLLNPRTLYDYNNKNNKFVVSEIDADWLDGNVTIAKQSKL